MRRITRILTFSLLLLLVSCASPEVDERLAAIEQEMVSRPDSALVHLDALSLDHRITHPRQRAWHALLYSQALDKNYIDTANDSIINIAVEYYESHRDETEHLFLAYYYKARVLDYGGNTHGAIDFLTRAETLNEQFDNDLAKGLLYAQMGKLYKDCYDYEKALLTYQFAHDYYEKGNIKPHLFYMKLRIGELYLYNKQYEAALNYLLPYKEWCYQNDQSRYRDCLILLAFLYENTNNITALNETLQDDSLDNVSDISLLLSRAYLSALSGNRVKAEDLLNQAQSVSQTLNDTLNLNFYRFRILKLRGEYKSALTLHEQLFHQQDSLTRIQLQQPLVTIQRDFYQNQAKQQELLLQNKKQELAILHTGIVIVILIIVLAIFIVRHILLLKVAKIAQYRNQIVELSESLKRSDDMMTEVRQLCSDQLNQIDRLCNTYYLVDIDDKADDTAYQLLKKEIETIRNDKQLFIQIEVVVNKFKENVMIIVREEFPDYHEMDYRLICFLYAQLSAKTISLLTGYTVENVYTRKKRFKKKISQLSNDKYAVLLRNLV